MATLKEILDLGRQQLQPLGEAYALEAELLLAHVLDKPRSHLFTWPEETVADETLQAYAALIHARQEGQPIAYLIGEREFWSMLLTVTPDTLIPRPETELLVEQALQLIPAEAEWQILDLGTGSGAIALALAKERPACHITATDISAAALRVAQQNAAQCGVSVSFIESDWFTNIAPQAFDMIVSNPPYIASEDPHLSQGDVRFEPNKALVAGDDGLDAYRTIISSAGAYLAADGWLLLEQGFDQAAAVRSLLETHNFHDISMFKDGAGHDRVSVSKHISNN